MQGDSYVSCIKINGVPILPPMITEDMKREISGYKESAITIEKKLAALRIVKQCNADTYIRDIKKKPSNVQCTKGIDSLKKDVDVFAYKNGNYDESNLTNINNDSPEALYFSKNLKVERKAVDETNLNHTSVSRSESAVTSINIDHRVQDSISMKSSSAETVSETWKPQVPKTLNIIPLTLTDTDRKENKEYEEGNLDNVGSTPKLIRQGSYVLDTPSPMLLAHMQMQLASSVCSPCSEYVPTSHSNTVHRKEWNVTGAKVEWEYETKGKGSISMESSKSLPMLKGDCNSNNDRIMCKSISLQTKLESPLGMFPSTRSADCIQALLTKENVESSNGEIDHDQNCITDTSNEQAQGYQTWKKCNGSTILNGTCKVGGSLGDVSERSNVSISSDSTEKVSRNSKAQDPKSKMKFSIAASDKLLTVYKRVQEMHKKQMAELMLRQQKEQTLLQEEFEKQQLLLLTEIRKSFPEFSVTLLSENVLSPSIKHITPHCCDNVHYENVDINTQQNIEILGSSKDSKKSALCPLDYIYPELNCTDVSCPTQIGHSEIKVGTKDTEVCLNGSRNSENKLSESVECKRSNVSRELFPLDSKTTHVPILERTMYTAKHIKAANVINAYVRGYLVRRMMRTERVIALKNTYKEALHCMLKLHVDAPLNRSEFNFLRRLQLQCDAASMNIAELFAQNSQKRMQVIAQDREIKQSRIERPTSARSYSFATQRTLARKKLKEMEECQPTSFVRTCLSRSRCQTWTSDIKEGLIASNILYHGIKRSTSAGTVRKPWR